MSDHTGVDGEGPVDRVCHDEQMMIWTGEIASSLSMGGYLREDLSYDDKLDLHAVITKDLRDIVGNALTHPALPASPISPSEQEAIETAGRALYMKNRGVPADAWDRDLPESTRDHWRDYARTALGAAGWPAPCDEPPSGRDRNGLGGDSPAGAVPAGQTPEQISDLKAENERLRERLADRTAERDAARRAHQQARADLAEAESTLKRARDATRACWSGYSTYRVEVDSEELSNLRRCSEIVSAARLATPTQETPHVES